MTMPTAARTPDQALVVRHLQELVAAIDRRVPQVQRAGEAAIARAAAVLRREALRRIDELTGTDADPSR
jgi:hypothetical protein